MQSLTRMTKVQFLNFVLKFRGAYRRKSKSGLGLHAACLLYKIRFCHNTPLAKLATDFSTTESTAEDIFYRFAIHQYKTDCNIPQILNQAGQINIQERDKLFRTAYENTPVFFRRLVQDLRDPSGRGRQPCILQCDATYFDTTGSADIIMSCISKLCSI